MELNRIQQQIITTDKDKVVVLSAAASGKTEVLTQRLRYLLDQGIDPFSIVAITFTNNAASVMYERLGRPQGLFIGTVHSYANYLLRGGAVDTDDIIKEERFDDLFTRIEENQECIKPIDYLMVDEAQDSTELQFRFFELLNPKHYMYIGDYRQSIYGFNQADPTYLIDKTYEPGVTVYDMNTNYRNKPEILRFAKKFLYRLGPDYEDDSIADRNSNGLAAVVEGKLTPSETVDYLCTLRERYKTQWKDWFLLCRTNADIELFKKLCTDKDIPVDTFKQADLTNSEIEKRMEENTLKILTVHSAKGLENKCVMVFNVRAYSDEEARVCYVAATRARDLLVWVKMPPKKKKKKTLAGITSWE